MRKSKEVYFCVPSTFGKICMGLGFAEMVLFVHRLIEDFEAK